MMLPRRNSKRVLTRQPQWGWDKKLYAAVHIQRKKIMYTMGCVRSYGATFPSILCTHLFIGLRADVRMKEHNCSLQGVAPRLRLLADHSCTRNVLQHIVRIYMNIEQENSIELI